jgi:4'-phosphopantetheinyl transferase EntD
LSPSLGSLFPPGALVAELREPGNPSLLFPAEAQYIGKAVLKRAQEFAAGRLCARALLAELGVHDCPVTVADDRQPVWPESLVGSITHTAGLCAAVVAQRTRLRAVGLDSEVAGSVKPELWPSICTSFEIEWLRSLPESQRTIAATLIFSAKEAFYKCQYPLLRERLGFHDARVEVVNWGVTRGEFRIHATKPIALAGHAVLPVQGKYLFHQQFVTAGIALAAAAGSAQ